MLTKAYSVQADIEEYKTSHAKKKVQNPYYLAWKPFFDGREMQDEIALKTLEDEKLNQEQLYSFGVVISKLRSKLFQKAKSMKLEHDQWSSNEIEWASSEVKRLHSSEQNQFVKAHV